MREITIIEHTKIHLPGCVITCCVPVGSNQTSDVQVVANRRWQSYINESGIAIRVEVIKDRKSHTELETV